MAYRSEASVYADLVASGLETQAAQSFAKGAALSGSGARDFVKENRNVPLPISLEEQNAPFSQATFPRFTGGCQNSFDAAMNSGAILKYLGPRT
jgi:hypothetical protein